MDTTQIAISKLRQGTAIGLEYALLVASGLDSQDRIRRYTEKIDTLIRQFHDFKLRNVDQISLTSLENASLLHRFLWEQNSQRYNSNVQLADVIDAELQRKVSGSCVGLSSLFAVLCLRERVGINADIPSSSSHRANSLELVMQHDHVRLRLIDSSREGERNAEIECTSEAGFGASPYKDSVTYPLKYLAAIAFNAKSTALSKQAHLRDAERYISCALEIWPDYIDSLETRASLRSRLKDDKGAEADYTKLISLQSYDHVDYYNRGVVRLRLKNIDGAAHDFGKAAYLRPEISQYHENKAYAEMKRGNYKTALEDCNRALRLDKMNADMYLMRAEIKRALGIVDGALEDLKTAETLTRAKGVCSR